MISKNALESSILRECTICKHLYEKLPQDAFDYRPSPGQRSTIELLRYLAIVGSATMSAMTSGDWGKWREFHPRVESMTPEEFPAMMDRQMEEIRELFAGLDEEEATTRMVRFPTGVEMPLGVALMESLLKWFTGYKMQLFLYAKASGVEGISTSNCWGGVDMPQKKAEEAKTEAATAEA